MLVLSWQFMEGALMIPPQQISSQNISAENNSDKISWALHLIGLGSFYT